MNDILNSYAAGCIDCDGSISIKRSTYHLRVVGDAGVPIFSERVMFAQVRRELLELLKSMFGGSYQVQRSPSANGKPIYHWQVTDRQAVSCIRAILPYLVIKRRQAELLLELRKLKEQPRVTVGVWEMHNRWGASVMMPRRVVNPIVIQAKEVLFNSIKELNDVRAWQPRLIGCGDAGWVKGGEDK